MWKKHNNPRDNVNIIRKIFPGRAMIDILVPHWFDLLDICITVQIKLDLNCSQFPVGTCYAKQNQFHVTKLN